MNHATVKHPGVKHSGKRLYRRHLLTAALALPAIPRAHAADTRTVRIGFQKGEPVLMTAKAGKVLENLLAPKGYNVEWIEFQFGPPMLEAMRVGSVDLGAVGDTPPIFAQAAHANLLYLGAQKGAPQSVLLPAGSRIQALTDLKGRRLAFGRGSSAHNFTLVVLEKTNLRYDEIQPIYLGPADAGPAFERGAIDAWSIWEPYTALFDTRSGVRTLTTNAEIGEQYGFILGHAPFVRKNPELAASLIEALARTAENARAHRDDVARLLSDATGIQQDVWHRAVARHPFTVLPMNDDLVASQQKVADRFRALGLVPVEIKVSDIVWRANA